MPFYLLPRSFNYQFVRFSRMGGGKAVEVKKIQNVL